jgi:hypothetical protein
MRETISATGFSGAENTFYVVMSLVSLTFIARALLSFRDQARFGGMIFLKARKFIGLYSVLFWGTSISSCLASGLNLVGYATRSDNLVVVSLAMFGVAFSAMTYFVVQLSFVTGGI